MNYEELIEELKQECRYIYEVDLWIEFRKDKLTALSFEEYKKICLEADFIKQCDYNCA